MCVQIGNSVAQRLFPGNIMMVWLLDHAHNICEIAKKERNSIHHGTI